MQIAKYLICIWSLSEFLPAPLVRVSCWDLLGPLDLLHSTKRPEQDISGFSVSLTRNLVSATWLLGYRMASDRVPWGFPIFLSSEILKLAMSIAIQKAGRGVVIFISQNYRKTLIMSIFFPSINATRTLFEEELCCIVSLHSRYSVNIYNSGIWIIDDIVNCTEISICSFTLGSQRWREDLENSPPISKETFPSSSRNDLKTWGETSCKT